MATKYNIIANILGRFWAALMSFAFVPLYVRFMGVEGYGLIGFFTSMLAVFFVLDMGLSTTLNRELARLSSLGEERARARALVRTLETIYWIIGLAICATVILAAPTIATRWLRIDRLPLAQAVTAVQLMGLVAMFRWPVALYSGALMGLQRQVVLNIVTSVVATLQGGGAVLILWLITPSVAAFFLWQAVVAFLQVVALILLTWRSIPLERHRARFERAALRSIAAFSAGITGITILSAVLTQMDKFLLSKLLPLEQFGFYSMASAIAGMLIPVGGAIYAAMFPVFSRLVADDAIDALGETYHRSCQILSVVIVPAAVTILLFSHDLLTVYFHDDRIVAGVDLLLKLQIVGNTFLTLMLLPVALQFAFGWTKLSFYKNVVAVALYVPALLIMVRHFGAPGGAVAWIMVTLGYFLFEIQIMHRRVLRGHQWRWYAMDVGIPLMVSLGVLGIARLLIAGSLPIFARLAVIAVAGMLAVGASALLLPGTRAILAPIQRLFNRPLGRKG